MSYEFITFTQEGCIIKELQVKSNQEIYAYTILEDAQINRDEDLGEFFICSMN